MQKLFLLSVLLLPFASCKKQYNCFCSVTINYPQNYGGGQNYFVSDNKPMNRKMTEKQAKSVCDNEAENIKQTHINYFTSNGAYPLNGVEFTSRCTLQ